MKAGITLFSAVLGVLANATGCWRTVVQAVTVDGSATTDGTREPSLSDNTVPIVVLPDAPASTAIDSGASQDRWTAVACLDGDDGCACPPLNVAVVGRPGLWGDNSDTAFQSWLNSNSAGTAKVDNYLTRPAFTADFLATYNLLILAALGDDSNSGPWWAFSKTEVAAFQDWLENKGGGVISLAGYSADSREITSKNELLAFTGISYQEQNISPPCIIFDANNSKMCYQCGNPYQIDEWNRTDPVVANLSLGVTMIGIDGGHPINAPADAHVAALKTNPTDVSYWLVGKLTGKGRVLVYADEWITYTDQWSGQDNRYSNAPSCTGFLPQNLYQTAQFWYNMIRWTQPGDSCFKLVSQQPVTIW